MFLRWMVRKDNTGVDFGIWESISPSLLSCPLDVHSGNVARKLGLIKKKAKRRKSFTRVANISLEARLYKYNLALFGLGIFEKF